MSYSHGIPGVYDLKVGLLLLLYQIVNILAKSTFSFLLKQNSVYALPFPDSIDPYG